MRLLKGSRRVGTIARRPRTFRRSSMPGAPTRCNIRRPELRGAGKGSRVGIGSGLHYDPLTNHDGAVWWVREAADCVRRTTRRIRARSRRRRRCSPRESEERSGATRALRRRKMRPRTRSLSGRRRRAARQVEANWRGWMLTRDPAWRSLALRARRRAELSRSRICPTTWGNELSPLASARRRDRGTPTRTSRTRSDRSRAAQSRRSDSSDHDRHGGFRTTPILTIARARRRVFRADGHVDSRHRERTQAHQLHARNNYGNRETTETF